MRKVSYNTVKVAMGVIADGAGVAFWSAPDGVKEIVMANRLWLPSEKTIVMQGLQSVLTGTLDSLGLPQIKVPAEYVAAAIVIVCSKQNWMNACSLYEPYATREAALQGEETAEIVSPDHMFNLCLAAEEGAEEFRVLFEAKFRPDREVENA